VVSGGVLGGSGVHVRGGCWTAFGQKLPVVNLESGRSMNRFGGPLNVGSL